MVGADSPSWLGLELIIDMLFRVYQWPPRHRRTGLVRLKMSACDLRSLESHLREDPEKEEKWNKLKMSP